jgi:hypothetical protein
MGSFTAKKVHALIKEGKPGRYGDGNGLYLMIPSKGAPYWMYRYTFAGKRRGGVVKRFVTTQLSCFSQFNNG